MFCWQEFLIKGGITPPFITYTRRGDLIILDIL